MAAKAKQIVIEYKNENPKGVGNEDSNLSGMVPIEQDPENKGTIYEIYQVNLLKQHNISGVTRIAIQGEPGLRFTFLPAILDPVEADTEETIDQKIENVCVTMSTVGIYEIDCVGFKINIEGLYVYLPKGRKELSKNIYIDILYNEKESKGGNAQ